MSITTEAEWLEFRRTGGIGASEAAAIVGLSPWCDNVELWRRKTGHVSAPDISNNDAVKYGHDAEPLVRGLFALDYAERYETEYRGGFDMVFHPEHKFIFATLDGRLREKSTGRLGVLEIKTTNIVQSMQKEKWWSDGQPYLLRWPSDFIRHFKLYGKWHMVWYSRRGWALGISR